MSLLSIALLFAMTGSLFMCGWAGFSNHQNQKANNFFILMMLGFASVLAEMAIYHHNQFNSSIGVQSLYTQVVVFSVPLTSGIPIFFYLFLKSALRLDSRFRRSDFLHLLIPVIYFILILPFALLDVSEQFAFYRDVQLGKDIAWPLNLTPERFTRLATSAVLGIFYMQLCWQELHSEVNLKKQDILKTAHHLKKNYLVMSLGIVMAFIFLMIRLPDDLTWSLSLLLILMALASSWMFIKLPELGHHHGVKVIHNSIDNINDSFPSKEPINQSVQQGSNPSPSLISHEKRYRSSVTEQMANQSMVALTQLLEDGIYKDSTLSLGKLAKEMKVSNHHLSQIINQQYQGSYYDLIHRYRINEAKRLLIETSFSIADITYEVGYNSKSVFYTEFKRQTQLTPSQYKKANAMALS